MINYSQEIPEEKYDETDTDQKSVLGVGNGR